jgi:hypothetical protein
MFLIIRSEISEAVDSRELCHLVSSEFKIMGLVSALAVDGRELGECYTPEFCLDHSAYNRFLSSE